MDRGAQQATVHRVTKSRTEETQHAGMGYRKERGQRAMLP